MSEGEAGCIGGEDAAGECREIHAVIRAFDVEAGGVALWGVVGGDDTDGANDAGAAGGDGEAGEGFIEVEILGGCGVVDAEWRSFATRMVGGASGDCISGTGDILCEGRRGEYCGAGCEDCDLRTARGLDLFHETSPGLRVIPGAVEDALLVTN